MDKVFLLLVVIVFQFIFSSVNADGLGDLAKILAALGGENECVFKCPRGINLMPFLFIAFMLVYCSIVVYILYGVLVWLKIA